MFVSTIASFIGSSEGAIKLLLSILFGYVLAFVHRLPFLYRAPAAVKHAIFTLEGLALCWYSFGYDSLHVWLNLTIIYLVLLVFGGNKFTAVFTFVFNTVYLVAGYYTQFGSYAYGISWTMPLCVLTLRLTAVAFDYYDGQKKLPEGSSPQNDAALTKRPSYLEMLGHTFFFGGVLVGPHISMKRYLAFVNGEYSEGSSLPPTDCIRPGFRRLLMGIAYILIFQMCALLLPDSYMMSQDYRDLGFFTKCALILIWGKNSIHKYCGIWLMQEGALILLGISYNGLDENGKRRYDACTNIKVYQLETGETFSDFIQSFNVNTNQWMLRYLHRRLKFLGNKMLSQAITLFYLALWHGLQSGYYVCFCLELMETKAEADLKKILKGLVSQGLLPAPEAWGVVGYWVGRAVRKVILVFLWAYALIAFGLLEYTKWGPIFWSVSYIGHVMCLAAIAGAFVYSAISTPNHKTNGVRPDVIPVNVDPVNAEPVKVDPVKVD